MAIDRDLDFTGKTILVTESGRSIGRHIVLEFAARGANVIINSRASHEEAESVEREARELGAKTLIVMGAAEDGRTVDEMTRRAEEAFRRVDIYVSNGVSRPHPMFFETSNEYASLSLDQQLTAARHLAKAFVPGMIEAGWGRIVHIDSADRYSDAGGALRALTKSLASDLGEHGITVNDVLAGYMETTGDDDTVPGAPPESARRARDVIPIGRQPRPDELAFAVAFLCSERAGAITGSTLRIDGGRAVRG